MGDVGRKGMEHQIILGKKKKEDGMCCREAGKEKVLADSQNGKAGPGSLKILHGALAREGEGSGETWEPLPVL